MNRSRATVDSVPAPVAALPAAERALWADIDALLRDVGCDEETLAAAAWYAVALVRPEAWTAASPGAPDSLRRLVEGQQQAERVWALHAARDAGGSAEGLRRLLLAIIRDLRVVYLLLARQLARMRAAAALPEAECRALAQLTRDLHAPLANRLGIGQWKWELEDLAFRYLQPDVYRRVAALLDERRADREAWIEGCVGQLREALAAQGISASVNGRAKHIYSIWRKMQRKRVGFGELYDIRALRVLTRSVADCYAVLGVVHALWPIIPQEFDDYIARPKGNNYRSLHTAVIGPDGKTLEVQIRTEEMHRAAELGIAAHWRYKESASNDAAYQARIEWMRRLLEVRAEGDDDAALAAELRAELAEDRVYLLTPKGEVIDLPAGATVLDFAYHVHTMVGHRCRGAKVNGRIVPLTHQPASGDRVEILTAREPAPSRDWLSPQLGYLATASARGKLRAWFRREDLAANLAAGRQMFEREARRLAAPDDVLERLPAKLGRKSRDELLVALALGEVGIAQLTRAMLEAQPAPQPTAAPPPRPAPRDAGRPGALTVEGVGNLMTTLARCCRPLPGDQVTGYITRGRGVTVHRADCAALARLRARHPARVIEVRWHSAPDRAYEVAIVVQGYDRRDLQRDVTNVIANSGARIVASDSRSDRDLGEVAMHFSLRVHDYGELSALLARLGALPNVIDARRLAGG
ncbi:MAG: bifunctional (p)ppGpp synthetase/guanosine-3',5'-bis(diphosphate) 3'-pyrophosphohydrolase [Rhodanobacteraceae bacterium]|jgi:GTP pyrophosphokinase|nr:MAG: bifunctional (p)ppGpp synthetase/guanosine-3',5'-bis(diphosphate) 3'-pyrophosphohydrolase [Rhodanobacteraceae bacterium]